MGEEVQNNENTIKLLISTVGFTKNGTGNNQNQDMNIRHSKQKFEIRSRISAEV